MFASADLIWFDFETLGRGSDLKADGHYAYSATANAIVCAFAVGDSPVQVWHANGETLDWDFAPSELRATFDQGATFAAWNASFDSCIWNFATLGFPLLAPERVIDPMIQAGVSNLPTDLESASLALGGAGKQKDGKKLIKLFCVEGAAPAEHPEEWARFLAYARQDVEAMRAVYRRTRPLPLNEWEQYWAFEHINQRGVRLDMPYVHRAAALAAEDGRHIGRRLSELTDGAVTRVTLVKPLAAWLHDQLPDAAMRAVLVCGVPAEDDEDNSEDELPELSLRRDRVARVMAMLEAKRGNGGLSHSEAVALEAATLRLYGAGASPRKFACLARQHVDGVLRGQYRFAGAGQTGRMCVDAETLVDTPVGPRRVVDLRPGDLVLTHRQRPRPVLARIHKGRQPMVRLNGPKGEHVVATLNHRLLTQRGWKKIDECFIKDLTGSFTLRDGCEPLSFIAQNNVSDWARPQSEPSHGVCNPEARIVAGRVSSGQSITATTRASAGSFALRDSYESLSLNARNDGNDWARPRSGTSHDIRDPEAGVVAGRVSSGQSGSLLLQQDRRQEPDVWRENRGGTYLAQRSYGGMERQWIHTGASYRRDEIVKAVGLAGGMGNPPYQRGQGRQQSGQFSNRLQSRTSEAAQTETWSLVPVGEREVWDISIGGDESYLAQGLAHHNSSKGAQIQNLTRDVLGEDGAEEAALVDLIADGCDYQALVAARPVDVPAARKLALLVRPALIAGPGKAFVWSDWSAIEARVTPWLAMSPGADKVLDIFRANDADPSRPDIYTLAAADILNKSPETIARAERAIGKVATLALGFGGSVGALQAMALNYRIHLDDAKAREIVRAWREANWWAGEFWDAIWDAALTAWELPGHITTAGRLAFTYREDYLGGTLFMALPSGRLLTYPRPRWREVEVKDKHGQPTGEKKTQLSFRRARGRAKLWHGTLCENAVQASAADLLRATVTRIETDPAFAFMPIRMTTHDEIVCEVDAARADEAKAILRREMLTLPDWAAGLPLQSEEQAHHWYTKAKAALR